MKFHGLADPSSVSCKKGRGHISVFSAQHYENIFKALHKNSNCHSPRLSTWTGWM